MPFFGRSTQTELPAAKRISAPNAQRLTTITEGGTGPNVDAPPPIPRRSSRRNSGGALHSFTNAPRRWSGSTASTQKTAPPPYDWVPEPIDDASSTALSAGDREKLARLRRGEDGKEQKRRGGWKRLAVIIGVVLLVVIALAVGLGVGLTRRKSTGSDDGSSSSSSSDDSPPQKFPLGQYSMITALKTIEYGCTTNQATWTCWPYTIFSPSTTESSLASFNWIISNTSDIYATSASAATSSQGEPANLTVSSTNDPFSLTFTNKPLTYVSASSNTSSARLTFSFTMNKVVVPSQAITTDNTNSKCFYNETTFTGTLYLDAPRDYPSGAQQHSSSLGGFEQWPHAVEITQEANGGTGVPECYETNDGKLGAQIHYGLEATASTDECVCGYRNY